MRAWGRGEDVEPEHKAHLLAICRQAMVEADEQGFGIFEQVAAAMAIRLYARSLASQDAVTCARALGEVVRSLRALRLLGTIGRVSGHRRSPGGAASVFTMARPEATDPDGPAPSGGNPAADEVDDDGPGAIAAASDDGDDDGLAADVDDGSAA